MCKIQFRKACIGSSNAILPLWNLFIMSFSKSNTASHSPFFDVSHSKLSTSNAYIWPLHLKEQKRHFQIALCTFAGFLSYVRRCGSPYVVSRKWSQRRPHLEFSILVFWMHKTHLRIHSCRRDTKTTISDFVPHCTIKYKNCNFTFKK